jgi:hypothetical protein
MGNRKTPGTGPFNDATYPDDLLVEINDGKKSMKEQLKQKVLFIFQAEGKTCIDKNSGERERKTQR